MRVGRDAYGSWRQALVPRIVADVREARRFAAARGWSADRVERFHAARSAHLDLVPPSVRLAGALVVDVGANVGAWTQRVLRAEPTVRVLAVEPDERARAALERRLGNDPRVRLDPRVVAGERGVVRLRATGHTANTSLLDPLPEMRHVYGGGDEWAVERVVEVEATTLDALTDGEPVALLKIDVQGAELAVLAGATATLRRTSAVLIEVNFVSHYAGGAEFGDVHRALRELDFVLAALAPPFGTPRHPALWTDACYVPRSSLPR